MKIVVDAMGGDYAPENVVAGVVEAVKEFDAHIVLIGIEDKVRAELKKHQYPSGSIEVIHAPEVVGMCDPATSSIRQKKNSSITLGIDLLKKDGYDAFVSAGNTGACVAAATFNLGMIQGVDRPAIGIALPTLDGFSFMLDVGATTDPKPEHLLQWGKLAGVYAAEVMGLENPSVGLLNIGEEAGKGTGFSKETFKLLQEKLHNFYGNIEANEIFTGKCKCIVCDGFVGNVVLKISEGLVESASKFLRREIKKSAVAMFGAMIMKNKFMQIKKQMDYSEVGGAPLLGVDGLVMICHGRSSPKAIKNAIRATKREVEHNILELFKKEAAS